MSTREASLATLEIVAHGLGDLCREVAFVGGATLALYIDDTAAPDVRATDDVDCVVEATSSIDMIKVEERLRRLGFRHHPDEGVICRWLLQGRIVVDVMPSAEKIFGFTNRWYTDGLRYKECRTLQSGRQLYVFPFPYFFASKLEAFAQRGKDVWDSSKDFEDIVSVLDGRRHALEQLLAASLDVRVYIREQARRLLLQPAKLQEAIAGNFFSTADQDRAPQIYQAFQALAAPRTPEMMLAEMAVPRTHWSSMVIRLLKATPMGSATFSVAAESARELAKNAKYSLEITWREKKRVRTNDYDNALLLTPEDCAAFRGWLRNQGLKFVDETGMPD